MGEKCRIYQGKEEFKELTSEILKEEQGLGIGAMVLTSMIDKKHFNPKFKNKRKEITKDLANAQVSARISKENLKIGFYLFEKEIPIIFEYQGPLAEEIYDKLSD